MREAKADFKAEKRGDCLKYIGNRQEMKVLTMGCWFSHAAVRKSANKLS